MLQKDINACHISSLRENPQSSEVLFALVLLAAAISAPLLREVLVYLFPQVSWVVFDSLHAFFSVIILAPVGYYFLFTPWKRLVSSYRFLTDELHSAQKFSSGVLDSLAAHIAVIDEKGRILSVNESWRRFARENPPVVVNVNEGADYFAACRAAQAQGDEIARSVLEGLEAIFSGEREDIFIEYPCHSPDTQRWFLCKARAFKDQNKTLVAITHVDITQRKLAEESVNQSDHLYRTLFATTGNATLIIEPDDTIALVNQEFENLCGYSRSEIEGCRKWTEFVTPESLNELPRLAPPVPGDPPRERRSYEIVFVRRGGETGCALVFVNDVAHEGRKVVSLTDITVRRRMEQELAQQRTQLLEQNRELVSAYELVTAIKKEWENTLDCVDSVVILLDDEGRLKRCNRALEKVTGRPLHEMIYQSLADLFDQLAIGFDTDTGDVEAFDEARQRWYAVDTYPFTGDGADTSGSVLTLHDTTEIKAANNRLEQINADLASAYEELQQTQTRILQQEKMASIGQLAAGVAHEINNPIGFIASNLGSLKKYAQRIHDSLMEVDTLEALDDQTRNALREIHKSYKIDFILEDLHDLIDESQEGCQRVARIVQDLKSFARIDNQSVQVVDLTDCLEKTLNIVWNEIKYKAEVVREYGSLPPVTCRVQQINQVFMNLLINAVQAIEKQGQITLKTWADEAFAYVSIADSGGGIDPECIERIFEPFFTTKDVGQGTGLGLSISYDILKKHGGDISVESRLGEGTVFTVKLPLKETVQGRGHDH